MLTASYIQPNNSFKQSEITKMKISNSLLNKGSLSTNTKNKMSSAKKGAKNFLIR